MKIRFWILLVAAAAIVAACGGCGGGGGGQAGTQAGTPADVREFRPRIGERWIGNAVSYGPSGRPN